MVSPATKQKVVVAVPATTHEPLLLILSDASMNSAWVSTETQLPRSKALEVGVGEVRFHTISARRMN
jgi:hypothetical protein